MSFEAITTIRDAENRAKQIQADAQAAAAAAVEAAQAEGKAAIEAAVGKAQRELQTLRAKSDEKAKADAEKLAAEGIDQPIWMSANMPGGDAANKALEEKYFMRVKHLR